MDNDDAEDKQAFIDAMTQVRPLKQIDQPRTKKAAIPKSKHMIKPNLKATFTKDTLLPSVIRPQPYQTDVYAEDMLSYRDPSINATLWRHFKQGKLGIERRLDLHGMTLVQAENHLEQCLHYAHEHTLRHLLIIHGKGSHDGHTPPILKNWLWRWLRNCPDVLAIHSAPSHLGGAGAVLVWLKKWIAQRTLSR